METVAGTFDSAARAKEALAALRASGIVEDRLDFITPAAAGRETEIVQTTETEQPGVGKALGGVIGGALGAAGGMSLGLGAASLLIPGLGPVIATGLIGAALLGAGGALGGAAAGEALEESLDEGLPRDELFVYEDAVRRGRTVIIARAADEAEAKAVREVFARAGAEEIDAARENWWIGLRDAAAEGYTGDDFERDEPVFRRGFEAALAPALRGRTYDEALPALERRDPEICRTEPFRCGFARGRDYEQNRQLTKP